MASLIAILDLKGKSLIQRSYRDDVSPSCVEKFLPIMLEQEDEGHQESPCFSRDGVNYMHIRHSNLYRAWIVLLASNPSDDLNAISARSVEEQQ